MSSISVTLAKHDLAWAEQFEQEAAELGRVLGKEVVIIHHIGSTAIPDVPARPVVDLLAEVKSLEAVDRLHPALRRLGYQPLGEHGIPARRFYIKADDAGRRVFNLFVFPLGHSAIQDCLDLRDYLTTHPTQAKAYVNLKNALAREHPHDLAAYMRGKEAFIDDVLQLARVWRVQPPGDASTSTSP